MGAAQLEQARAPARGLVRSAGGSARRRVPEADGAGPDGLNGFRRREAVSFTAPSRGCPPFYL
jgi:hypothetical protein